MCSKVLNGHIILTDTSITTILAPEMTYTPKFHTTMNELVKTIDELYAAFKTDAELQAGKNNKAAGLRARKVSLELEKKLKEFRKTSLAAAAK